MKNILDERPLPYEELIGFPSVVCDFMRDKFKNKKALNIGCGFGWLERFACEYGEVSAITGIEPAESNLAAARTLQYDPRITFQVASGIDLPFNNNSFDLVTSFEVLEHLPKKTEQKFFNEVERVLSPGGTFILSTPYAHPASTFLDPAYYLVGHRHYKKSHIECYSAKCGLNIEEIYVTGGVWVTLGILNLYISKWIFRRGLFFTDLFHRKQLEEYKKMDGFMNIVAELKK